MKRVIVESPFKGDLVRNKQYLERCLRDCIRRGESPYASHKMLTDCLDDDNPNERILGIEAGLAWKRAADLTAFYTDFGWSDGMELARDYCQKSGLPYEVRSVRTLDEEKGTHPMAKKLTFILTRAEVERLSEEIGDIPRSYVGPKLFEFYRRLDNALGPPKNDEANQEKEKES